jgi:hypothetical protein
MVGAIEADAPAAEVMGHEVTLEEPIASVLVAGIRLPSPSQ